MNPNELEILEKVISEIRAVLDRWDNDLYSVEHRSKLNYVIGLVEAIVDFNKKTKN